MVNDFSPPLVAFPHHRQAFLHAGSTGCAPLDGSGAKIPGVPSRCTLVEESFRRGSMLPFLCAYTSCLLSDRVGEGELQRPT